MGRSIDESLWSAWRRRLARYGQWCGSVARFCEQEGVSVAGFYQWRRKLTGKSSTQAATTRGVERPAPAENPLFFPVRIETPAVVEIEFPNGVRMRVPAHESAALEAVIGAVGRVARRRESVEEARTC